MRSACERGSLEAAGGGGKLGLVDVHAHLLPGIDDGPTTLADAVSLAQAFVAQGARLVIATPHVSEAYAPRPKLLHERVVGLRSALNEASIRLEVELGAEVALGVARGLSQEVLSQLTLGQGGWVLLEPPHGDVFPFGLLDSISELRARGHSVLIAHPERNRHMRDDPTLIRESLSAGGFLQVTGESLLGGFGRRAKATAWRLLDNGWAHVVASDAHGAERRAPQLDATWNAVERRLGGRAADLLHVHAPSALADGASEKELRSMAPSGERSTWFRARTS